MNRSSLRLVGNAGDAAQDPFVATVERSADGSITIHQTIVHAPPDDLVPFPFGLEVAAASSLVRRRKLRAVKIGRRLYAKRSDVLALVDELVPPKPASASPADTYAALVARKRSASR